MSSIKKEKTSKKKEKKEKEEAAAPSPIAAVEASPAAPPAEEKKEKEKKSEKKEKEKKSDETRDKTEEEREEKREEPREIKRAQRATSNVFALFNSSQIQEFKEAFTMIDQNRDGLIDPGDLQAIYEQIGHSPEFQVLTDMVNEAPGPLNFTIFLGLFGDKLKGTDPESTLREAFMMFDEEGKGKLNAEYVKDLLMTVGDQFSKDEIKQVWKEAPIEGGMLDYMKFVNIMKRGKED